MTAAEVTQSEPKESAKSTKAVQQTRRHGAAERSVSAGVQFGNGEGKEGSVSVAVRSGSLNRGPASSSVLPSVGFVERASGPIRQSSAHVPRQSSSSSRKSSSTLSPREQRATASSRLSRSGTASKALAAGSENGSDPLVKTGRSDGSQVGQIHPVPEDSIACMNDRRVVARLSYEDNEVMKLRVAISSQEVIHIEEIHMVKNLSTGSFGEVWEAVYRGRHVSVKRCLSREADGAMTKEQLLNFEREINTFKMMNHPAIVKFVGCVLAHPHLCIVTELAPMGNVFDLLYWGKVALDSKTRLRIAGQTVMAISYMHNCDPTLVHRDLKTQNLVLDEKFNAKLCDFGKTLALIDGKPIQLPQGDNGGSPRYMAPECFHSDHVVTEKVDIWSLGCCLVEMLGGPIPYEEYPRMEQVHECLLQGTPPTVPHWFSEDIRSALSKCYEFSPGDRLTAGQVLLSLNRLTPAEMERCGMDKRRPR